MLTLILFASLLVPGAQSPLPVHGIGEARGDSGSPDDVEARAKRAAKAHAVALAFGALAPTNALARVDPWQAAAEVGDASALLENAVFSRAPSRNDVVRVT